jgi:hypothetical protein
MELTGDLSDFALTDILQILALSRKTGTLSLDSMGVSGRIIIEQGRITYASVEPGETLADQLVRESKIAGTVLNDLMTIGLRATGVWTLETLLIESGVINREELEAAAKRHIQNAVAVLVGLEKGRFGIDLNHSNSVDGLREMKLLSGVEVGEALLEAAKDKDEFARMGLQHQEPVGVQAGYKYLTGFSSDSASDNDRFLAIFKKEREFSEVAKQSSGEGSDVGASAFEEFRIAVGNEPRVNGKMGHASSLLFSMLAELRSHSFEAEVSLLIMRYASEFASRGVLFVVKKEEICGLGQFGVECKGNGRSPDELVREIRIPLGTGSIFDDVVRSGYPFMGVMPEHYWHSEMLGKVGGVGIGITSFVLPLMCNDEAIFVFYGDNYPGLAELTGLEELIALVNQASIVLEKMVLERMVVTLKEQREA